MQTEHWFKNWAELNAFNNATGTNIIIAKSTVALSQGIGLTLKVSGLARGASDCTLALTGVTPTIQATAPIHASGTFEGELVLPSSDFTSLVSILATIDDGTSVVSDAILFSIDADALPPTAQIHPLDPGRLGYGAGNIDRVKLSHSFVKFDSEPKLLIATIREGLKNVFVNTEYGDIYGYTYNESQDLQPLEIQDESDSHARITKIQEHVRTMFNASLNKTSESKVRKIKAELKHYKSAKTTSRSQGLLRSSSIPVALAKNAVSYVIDSKDVPIVLDKIIASALANLRLGMIFRERLRIRPLRLVPGEPFYQLSLVPGEEVEILQRSETKQLTSLADITDKEQERTSSLSSTWSTDLGSSIGSSSSHQNSTSLGGGIDATIPKVNIGLSANAAQTAAEAHSTSANDSVSTHYERTAQAATRLRSQHKIKLEISAEETSSLTSTRRLRNANISRTQHHKFYKVYRKEQISLERYDARLCLRLRVEDPAQDLRTAFKVGIMKVQPRAQAMQLVPLPPGGQPASMTFRVNAPPYTEPLFHGFSVSRIQPWSGDLRTMFNMPDMKLAAPPAFYLTQWGSGSNVPLVSSDGSSLSPDVIVTKDRCTHVYDFLHVSPYGLDASIEITDSIDIFDENDTDFAMNIDMPIRYDSVSPVLGGEYIETTYVQFDIETVWTSSSVALNEYRQALIQKEMELAANFDPATVKKLVNIAEADYRQSVVSRALQTRLDYAPGFDFQRVTEIFETENAMIDSVGFWATEKGRNHRNELHTLILNLPGNYATSDVLIDELTASSAVVYLPIRLGREEEALELLPEARNVATAKASSFRQFHDTHFGSSVPSINVSVDEHLGPKLPDITDSGASQWASDWERPQRKFDLLGQWSEFVPTDGVHVETHLSESVVIDSQVQEE